MPDSPDSVPQKDPSSPLWRQIGGLLRNPLAKKAAQVPIPSQEEQGARQDWVELQNRPYEEYRVAMYLRNAYDTPDAKAYSLGRKAPEFTEEQWKKALAERLGLEGRELENAATLLGEYVKGLEDTRRYHLEQRGQDPFPLPKIYITEGVPTNRLQNKYVSEDGLIVFLTSLENLKYYATKDPNEVITHETPDGELIFKGTVKDWFYYSAVEECDHAAWSYDPTIASDTYSSKPQGVSLAEYDNVDVESRWLETASQLPHTQGLPDALRSFSDRRAAAKAFRENSQGASSQ